MAGLAWALPKCCSYSYPLLFDIKYLVQSPAVPSAPVCLLRWIPVSTGAWAENQSWTKTAVLSSQFHFIFKNDVFIAKSVETWIGRANWKYTKIILVSHSTSYPCFWRKKKISKIPTFYFFFLSIRHLAISKYHFWNVSVFQSDQSAKLSHSCQYFLLQIIDIFWWNNI